MAVRVQTRDLASVKIFSVTPPRLPRAASKTASWKPLPRKMSRLRTPALKATANEHVWKNLFPVLLGPWCRHAPRAGVYLPAGHRPKPGFPGVANMADMSPDHDPQLTPWVGAVEPRPLHGRVDWGRLAYAIGHLLLQSPLRRLSNT